MYYVENDYKGSSIKDVRTGEGGLSQEGQLDCMRTSALPTSDFANSGCTHFISVLMDAISMIITPCHHSSVWTARTVTAV